MVLHFRLALVLAGWDRRTWDNPFSLARRLPTMETATLGGGCFWCVEAALLQIEGVEAVVSGYAGGETQSPTYEQVCSGRTGHAEVTQVTFDPAVIGFADLLEVFFSIHDPTTKDRQGADVGTQYRSIVLAHDEGQMATAAKVMESVQAYFDDPIVTELTRLDTFWPGEAHHQNYYARNPNQGYCAAVIAPKLAKLRQKWAHRLKAPAA